VVIDRLGAPPASERAQALTPSLLANFLLQICNEAIFGNDTIARGIPPLETIYIAPIAVPLGLSDDGSEATACV
jgi:hypothetical protein